MATQVCPKCFSLEVWEHRPDRGELYICDSGHVFEPLPVDEVTDLPEPEGMQEIL